ncbi:MAG: hypothetical protein LKE39_04600 [Sphaerochaeta sp.]|jgi:hypothetical protein|nr:hypothetical protein [Sphaerochaeta sp.]MCH3919748.1 hypothetical protein [Sphaerochaeta sp.]MCI2045525.1 hypothetical protein [Sphaerochaeta sp.]MCI2076233.1 hypothetical protein [Sphaerochaeta sp.]MCI2104724.1 hypothetical protein [Sphaerochaeta sp.]
MIGFFIKKVFWDGWDNLLGLVLQNLLYMVVLFALLGCLSLGAAGTENASATTTEKATPTTVVASQVEKANETVKQSEAGQAGPYFGLSVVLLCLVAGLFAFLQAGTGAMNHAYARYERVGWAGFKRGIRTSWRHALLYWLVVLFLAALIGFVMPFYLSYGNMFGLVITVILFWVAVAFSLAIMYYYPLHFMMEGDRPLKTLKKCFIFVADNTGVSLFCALDIIVQAVISVFTVGLIPGTGGIQLTGMVAGKLLMKKYDYLEANPGADRKHLPWADLLYEENESIGPRSLKGMIFPWKD